MITFDSPYSSCPLCGGKYTGQYCIQHKTHSFETSRCTACGFIFMNPAFSDETIHSFYSSDYYSGLSSFSYIDERSIEKYSKYTWNARIASIRRYIKNGNFLDVGCSFGGLLSCASGCFTPYGIELSEYSGAHARERFAENIHIGTLFDAPFTNGFFSVITMVELIEHLKDPMKALIKCRELLTDSGMLLIQTADMDGWQAIDAGEQYHYYLPGHLSYFTANALSNALIRAGFSRIKIFRPVDFGLLPKLLKSRESFTSLKDYKRWLDIAKYHIKGKFKKKGRPLTSSMTIYAFK
jgi:2-polyprenyl-3-methyl-5-hydroxy-6-metoxy-1,4-benzoquinol methylase